MRKGWRDETRVKDRSKVQFIYSQKIIKEWGEVLKL